MTNDDPSRETKDRMRALALDAHQAVRERDFIGVAESLEGLVQHSRDVADEPCSRRRMKLRSVVAYSVRAAAIARLGHDAVLEPSRSRWWRIMRLTLAGLLNAALLVFRARVLARFYPCRCPKDHGGKAC